ncbi:MAG: amidohydrolase family protein [Polynucleobacter sp.]|jgi:predicted amidohydrolase YtcJ|uniref:amidohydrolase n=1 Tax=Polynucleobacter sp. TaxID=2029855 RepID=UPI00272867FB|nr:amidohydrolase [Polynucleobacter sp.]MDO8713817.1 amidohydrolase family protein [Polynucleobacter sp.]
MKLTQKLLSVLLLSQCALAFAKGNADTIFYGGDIVTMNQAQPKAEAVAIQDGKIIGVGSFTNLKKLQGEGTKLINLNGQTLMPGMVEPHVHIMGTAFSEEIFLNLSNFTMPHDTLDSLVAKLTAYSKNIKDGDWINAFGVDPSRTEPFMSELTADILDKVSTTKPIFILNQSMHIAYVNHKALEVAGLTDSSPDPKGGKFLKDSKGHLTGVVYEAPAFYLFLNKMPLPTQEVIEQAIVKVGQRLVSKGVTTSAEITVGGYLGVDKEYALFNAMTRNGKLPVRVRGYMYSSAYPSTNNSYKPGQGDDSFKLIGVKIVADGSNQGLTGAMTKPYDFPAGTKNTGTLNFTEQELYDLAKPRFDEGWQISVHSNGDKSIEQTLNVFERLVTKPSDVKTRLRIEHFTVPTEAQISRAAKLGVVPGFTIGHTDYWGEAFHDHLLGAERANRIDPSASLIKKGMHFAYHSDSPVSPIHPLKYASEGAARLWQVSPQKVLNANQKVSINNALKAVTIDAAYQLKMDDKVGSIEKGKYADFAIVDKNPMKTDAYKIRDIEVNETWINGRQVFKKN